MVSVRFPRTLRTIPLLIVVCLLGLPAHAKYSGGTGEPNDPYQIATAADLILLGETPADYDKHFILTADIDLSAFDGRASWPAFSTIGDCYVEWSDYDPPCLVGLCFTGVFEGDAHTISHLTVTKQSGCGGLFGGLGSGGEIKNLRVMDADVTSSDGVGVLVGCNSGGTLTDCYSTGVVKGEEHVGGLVGYNFGTVIGCYSTAIVTGGDYVGGLVGRNSSDNGVVAVVSQCYSTGAVNGEDQVGGLVGYNYDAWVTHCYSTGAVAGTAPIGGLVGWNYFGDVTHCHSTGAVNGAYHVGGLVGRNERADVTQCYSTGAVTSTGSTVGGLVGDNFGTVTQCHSTSMVKGPRNVGGLVGSNGGVVTQCYSAGTVGGTGSPVGGLVGWNDNGTVTCCYSTSAVNGGAEVGGLVGANEGVVTDSYSVGPVSGTHLVGGLVGVNSMTGAVGTDTGCFWDKQTSGQASSAGGMQRRELYACGGR